jgi:catechol 2,3-dioxygenase-like lactoylglutathione lyase family enzyme
LAGGAVSCEADAAPRAEEESAMAIRLDHLILMVNDLDESIDFYTRILGFTAEAPRPPFATVRVSPDFVLQLAPWGTKGGDHLAFAMTREEADGVYRRVREAGIPYGDAFDGVGNMRGPGTADGAHGATRSLYVDDPSKHLIEVIHYE